MVRSRRTQRSQSSQGPYRPSKRQAVDASKAALALIGTGLIGLIIALVLLIDDKKTTETKAGSHEVPTKAPSPKEAKPPSKSLTGPKTVSEPDEPLPKVVDLSIPLELRLKPQGRSETVELSEVLDGDTFKLKDGRKLRLIGIMAPGRGHAHESKARTALYEALRGKTIRLSYDVKESDRYKRQLAYVFADQLFVNGFMVREGHAYASEWKPNSRHTALLSKQQAYARQQRAGLWAVTPTPSDVYILLSRSHLFHRPDCKRVLRSKGQKTEYKSRDGAFDAGKVPCSNCNP